MIIASDPRGLFWLIVRVSLWVIGVVAIAVAIVNERRMQKHRRPGVSYADVTLRKDGAWRNKALFDDDGLNFQGRASKWGVIGVLCIIAAIIAGLSS